MLVWLAEEMDYRSLGTTGVQVSKLCLGTMMFGAWGNPDHEDSVRIIHRAVDAGINIIDTADMYSFGESEVIVGEALQGLDRDHIVLATKVHGPMSGDPNAQGNSRRWVIAECENSLKRLGTDYIDLYQIHRPSPETDIDDTLGALSDLVHAGKIRYAGCSTFPAYQVVESHWVAERRGRERFRTEQPQYSMLSRGIEADLLPGLVVVHLERLDVDVVGEDQLVDAHVAGLGVYLYLGVLHGVGSLLVGGEQRVFERDHEGVESDALLLLNLPQSLDDVSTHVGLRLCQSCRPRAPWRCPAAAA